MRGALLAAVSGRRRPSPLILDFRAAAATFGVTAPAGCGYSRAACVSSVQTGASSLVDLSAFSAVANVIASGRASDSWEYGIVLEGESTNLTLWSRGYSQAPWTKFGGTTLTAGQASPLGGTGATLITVPSGGVLSETGTGSETAITGSAWVLGATPNFNIFRTVGAVLTATLAQSASAWGRIDLSATGGASATAIEPVDGRGWVAQGGYAAGARSVVLDLCQREPGLYPHEWIPTAGAAVTRPPAYLSVPGAALASRLVGGRVGILRHVRFKGARSEYSGTRYLWWLDANNHVSFAASTGVVTVTIAGATNATDALTWSRHADAQVFVEMGAGVSYVAVLIDGVRTVPAITGSALGSLSAGDLYLGSSNVGGHTCAWNYKAGFFAPGTRPDWAR